MMERIQALPAWLLDRVCVCRACRACSATIESPRKSRPHAMHIKIEARQGAAAFLFGPAYHDSMIERPVHARKKQMALGGGERSM